MPDLFSKFDSLIEQRESLLESGLTDPFNLVMEKVESPTVAICNGRRTILLGEIKQEAGGNDLRFETSAIQWDKNVAPTVGQRLSHDVGQTSERQPCALNLQTI